MTQKEKNRVYSKRYREKHKDKIREYDREKRPSTQSYKKVIARLRAEKGNKCSQCGYSKEPRILHFHHLRDKLFTLAERRRKIKEMEEEAEKCVLLCPNCHALVHLISI